MANEKLIIEVDLQTGKSNKTFQKIEQGAANAGEKAGRSFSAGFKRKIGGFFGDFTKQFIGLQAINKTFNAVSNSIKKGLSSALDFRTGLVEINTILPKNQKLTQAATDSLRNFAAEFGTSSQKQAKAFYQIVSAGITDTVKAQEVLNQANKLAIGGLADLGSTINVLTDIVNVYGGQINGASEASDSLFKTVQLGKTTISELAGSLGAVLPAAKNLGISLDSTNAALATLSTQGLSTAENVTQLRSLFNAFAKNQVKINKVVDTSIIQTEGLASFLDKLAAATGRSSTKLFELLGRSEAVQAALRLTGDQFENLTDNIDSFSDKTGIAVGAYAKLKQTPEQQIKEANASFQLLTQTLAEAFLPTLGKVANATADFIRKFGGFESEAQKTNRVIKETGVEIAELTRQLGEVKKVEFDDGTLTKQLEESISRLKDKVIDLKSELAEPARIAFLDTLTGEKLKAAENSLVDINKQLDNFKNGIVDINNTKSPFELEADRAATEKRIKNLRQQLSLEITLTKMNEEEKTKITVDEANRRITALQNVGLNELQQLQLRREQQLQIIREAEETGIQDKIGFNERRLQVEREFKEQKKMLDEQQVLDSEASFEKTAEAFKIQAQRMKGTAGALALILRNSLASGIGNSFQAVGRAMANGANMFDAFAASVKATFADLASAIGDYYIKTGIAELALSGGAKGKATVAAGIGLKVLSGVLGASGASGGASASGGGSGGTGSFAGATDLASGAQEEQEIQEAQPQTNVAINVQGDILDSDESGTRIATLLSDAFGKQGVVLTDARIS